MAEQCLAAHNYYRCLHGVEDLEYDYRLEDSAKAYVNTLPTRPSEIGMQLIFNEFHLNKFCI